MKKILVTTDLSEESKHAFGPALELTQALNGKLQLLAVIEDPAHAAFAYALDFPLYPDPDIHKQVLAKVQNDLQDLAKIHFAGIDCTCTVIEATAGVHLEIVEFAAANGSDLIIMATHGRTGFSHLLIGSVAERVVREAKCPVLVVPSKKNWHGLKDSKTNQQKT